MRPRLYFNEFWFLSIVILVVFSQIGLSCCTPNTGTVLKTNWTKWIIDRSELQDRLNETNCDKNDCVKQLLNQLHEIHQDLVYANKTINIERVSSRLSQRLDDMDAALEEYSIASKLSQDSLDRSIKQISARYYQNNNATTDDKQIGLFDIVNSSIAALELEASRLKSKVENQMIDMEEKNRRQATVLSKIESLGEQHQHLMKLVSSAQDELQSLANMNYTLNNKLVDCLNASNQPCDVIEYNAKHLDIILEQSKLVLSDQLQVDSHIADLKHIVSLKTQQMTNLSIVFDDIIHDSRAARLITTRFLKNGNSTNLDDKQLEDRLLEILAESTQWLNSSLNTRDQFWDFKQSLTSNDGRVSDEQLVSSESSEDIKIVNWKLEKLSMRLSKEQNDEQKLRNELVKL